MQENLGDQVEIRWKSYALLLGRTDTKMVGPHNRTSRAQAAQAEPSASFEPWDASKPYISSSLPALEAAKCAALQGPEVFQRYHRALFRGMFLESRDISDYEELQALAVDQELDVDRFKLDLASGKQKIAVIEEHLAMLGQYSDSPSGLPLVLIGDREPIVGAAHVDLYQGVIERQILGRIGGPPYGDGR